MSTHRQRQHDLEMQAVAKQADEHFGLGKKTESEIQAMATFAKIVLLPFEAGLYFIVSDMLLKASMDNDLTIRQSGDVAQKAKLQSSGPANANEKPSKKIKFRQGRKSDKQKFKTVDNKKVDFRSVHPVAVIATRPLNKQNIQQMRGGSLKPIDFRGQLRPRPTADLSKDARLTQAEDLVRSDNKRRQRIKFRGDKPDQAMSPNTSDMTPVYPVQITTKTKIPNLIKSFGL